MAATIKTKIRTTTGGTASTTAGELCVNTADKKIFIGDGAASVDLFGNLATTAGKLSQFAATTSAELAGVISNETGSGSLVFGTSPSISTLEISTTGGANKYAAINMASGVTATRLVSSTITLNAYSADYLSVPAVPFTKTGYITCDAGYDLKLGTGYDSYISFEGNSILIGDVAGANGGGVIKVDGPDSGYISLAATNITLIGATGSALLGISGDGQTIQIGDIEAWNDSVMISVNIQSNTIALTNATYVNIDTSHLKLATTTPAVGKVLTCMDGDGTVSWETPTSGTPDFVLFNLGII